MSLVRVRLWFLLFPILIAASEGAHSLLDAFAPRAYLGAELFDRDSATEVLRLPLAGLGIGLVVAACAGMVVERLRKKAIMTSVPARVVAVTPLVLFTVQEHVEYLLGHGHLSVLFLQPAFLVGLGLQLPFALAAWAAAALLLRLTAAIAQRLAASPRRAEGPGGSLRYPGRRCAYAFSPGRARPARGPPSAREAV